MSLGTLFRISPLPPDLVDGGDARKIAAQVCAAIVSGGTIMRWRMAKAISSNAIDAGNVDRVRRAHHAADLWLRMLIGTLPW